MSVIHEALKKSGQPIMTETPRNAQESRPGFRPELLRKKPRSNWGPFVGLVVLVLVGAPVIAPLLDTPSGSNPVREISAGSPFSASSNMKRQFAIEEAPLPAMPALSKARPGGRMPLFSLTGLVYSNTDSYCLINGQVVRVGDRVGDAVLSQVTPEGAVLDYRGEKIVLLADGT